MSVFIKSMLIELKLTKQLTRSISQSAKGPRAHARVRHMATHSGVCVSACVRACVVWFSFPANKETLIVPLVRASDAFTTTCPLPRSHRPAGLGQTAMDPEAFLRTHLSVPLSTNALGQRHSCERRRNVRKTRNQVTLRAKCPRAQRRQRHCRRNAPSTASKERSSMNSMQTTATQRERPLSTQNRQGRMCWRHVFRAPQVLSRSATAAVAAKSTPCQSVVRTKKVIHIQRGLSK